MRQYWDENGVVKFFVENTGRIRKTRKRWSHVYDKIYAWQIGVPFKVDNYFGPAFFYNGIMDHRRKIDCGYLVVHRGIDRNLASKEGY